MRVEAQGNTHGISPTFNFSALDDNARHKDPATQKRLRQKTEEEKHEALQRIRESTRSGLARRMERDKHAALQSIRTRYKSREATFLLLLMTGCNEPGRSR